MADSTLPEDIRMEILSRLSVKCLLQFRCVSKSWFSLITNPSFITKHLTHATHNTNENLIIQSESLQNSKYVISMLLHGEKTLVRSINLKLPFAGSSSNRVKIVGSCNGLLCVTLSHLSSDIFLWNPTTREYRNIPEPGITIGQFKRRHSVCFGFGFHAKAKDYKLVRLLCYMALEKPPAYKAEVYSKKRDSWKRIKVVLQCCVSDSSPATFFGGGFHWIAGGSEESELIAYYDMGREVFGELQLPDSFGFGIEFRKELAVVSDLLAVIVHSLQSDLNSCIDVWVMNEYGVEESWAKQLSIGPFTGFARPMACFRNGKFVLQNNEDELFLYDSNTQEFDDLPLCRARIIFDIHTCMESLVSVMEGN